MNPLEEKSINFKTTGKTKATGLHRTFLNVLFHFHNLIEEKRIVKENGNVLVKENV